MNIRKLVIFQLPHPGQGRDSILLESEAVLFVVATPFAAKGDIRSISSFVI